MKPIDVDALMREWGPVLRQSARPQPRPRRPGLAAGKAALAAIAELNEHLARQHERHAGLLEQLGLAGFAGRCGGSASWPRGRSLL